MAEKSRETLNDMFDFFFWMRPYDFVSDFIVESVFFRKLIGSSCTLDWNFYGIITFASDIFLAPLIFVVSYCFCILEAGCALVSYDDV